MHVMLIRRFIFLRQIYCDRADKLQELKKDSSDFSLFYVLKIFFNEVKIYFYFFLTAIFPFFYVVRKNSFIFEG